MARGGSKMKMKMRGGGGGSSGSSSNNSNSGSSGGASTDTCPNGSFCLTSTMLFFILALIIVAGLIYAMMQSSGTSQQQPTVIYAQPPQPQPRFQAPTILNVASGGDSRYDRAPQPLRDWNAGPEFPPRGGIASIPINIPTQGLPERFQSVGIMTTPDGQVLPLYGRRTATSTDRWNYYTRTDTYNPVPIPVSYKKRDCMDDIGCDELMDGEEVKNFGTGSEGKVHIYRMDGPKYIPGII